jgi:hypothetical protein
VKLTVVPTPTTGPVTIYVSVTGPEVPTPTTAAIYDVVGRMVRELRLNDWGLLGGVIRWDDLDDNGEQVSSGVYLFRIESARSMWTTKFVVLR